MEVKSASELALIQKAIDITAAHKAAMNADSHGHE